MSTNSNPNKLITPEARLSFPSLFKPHAMEGSNAEPKYDCVLLFPKTADLSALKAAASAAVKEKWPSGAPKGLRSPFRDGDEKELDGYAGCIYLRVSSKNKPGVVDETLQPIIEASGIYAGCYVRASVRAYAYDQNGNKGVAFGLNNIQKLRDGEPFGGGPSKAEDDFEAVASAQSKAAPNTAAAGDADPF
jgi:hypothetical protein